MVQNTNIMAPCLNGYAFASWSVAACFILALLRPLRYLQFASDLIRVFLSQEKKTEMGVIQTVAKPEARKRDGKMAFALLISDHRCMIFRHRHRIVAHSSEPRKR